MYCPSWIFEIAVCRIASEYLGSEFPMETAVKKYAEGLSETYAEISPELLAASSALLIEFLGEIEAGENAVPLLNGFTHFRLYSERVGIPRKMKPLFGSIEDPVKQVEYSEDLIRKSFRAYVYRLRSNQQQSAPAGWRLEDDENLEAFGELVRKQSSLLDFI